MQAMQDVVKHKVSILMATALSALLLSGCGEEEAKPAGGIDPKVYTDSLFAVMNADRTNYTKLIIARLGPQGADSIKPHEYWEDLDNGAPLPAQMFRYGAEAVSETSSDFSYSLQSLWPINSQNAPKTELEKEGLQFIVDNPGENFYGTETLGEVSYYTAVYPDVAVAAPCVACHNNHKDSPKTDFEMGDVMGGVVIRVPM
ncbi:MAG: DUF3365 domain-containing protein [Pseudomonadales bacterium]|nr:MULTISPECIES: DUF3365 domain-containing protein [Alcanivorax]ERP92034.1 hypothetical protein Q670_10470 [Alcanivorax sp. P2S70]MCG8438653.1 DUF3365 domain-containing protein [Pseudomonadales bacterium]PNE01688.1 hypothetical protein A15D_02766 [Alcanivorax sp. MD8A]|tara:strand:+ start:1957 stop:2559 length:603 start_codon:yes stop_codon:yes gene_type:complete